jgi:hypothetical protein
MTRYLGGLITADETKTIPADNFQNTSASGIWTLSEAEMLNKQSLWPTAGNAKPAIENLFSTDVYKGASGSLTVNNGIDLSGEGGMVWHKGRDIAEYHNLFDTVRGNGMILRTSVTNASDGAFFGQAFTSTGWSLNTSDNQINSSSNNYVAWTFRKASKFFDVVQYSGTGSEHSIAHSLGQVPGMIIHKRTDTNEDWRVYHRMANGGSSPEDYIIQLNGDDDFGNDNTNFGAPSSTHFTVKTSSGTNNGSGTYIAYLFGHDTSSDGMIQCGTYNGSGSSGNTVTLGFEPQWVMIKRSSGGNGGWIMFDNIRGLTTDKDAGLFANAANAEDSQDDVLDPTSTGFVLNGSFYFSNASGSSYIYVAIRKAPMATPTSRASVFDLELGGSSVADDGLTINTGFPVDLAMFRDNYASGGTNAIKDRLRGNKVLATELTNNEQGGSTYQSFDSNDGLINRAGSSAGNLSGGIYYAWKRAPKYFDMVAYTGNGNDNRNITHNLGVVPDMMWMKMRTDTGSFTRGWAVTSLHLPNASVTNDTTLYLNTNAAEADEAILSDTGPTSTVFTVSSDAFVNRNGSTYIAYLFATLAGISKVGTFSHTNGSSTDVDCGFSSGSSFVIVKRTDSTGDWYNWDSVRGIVSGNDPYLLLNTNASQNSSYDYIDTLNSGFQIASGFTTGTYFFYAIAA